MRIVHVSDCYAPRVGGIETQVRDLARNQVLAGHEVHVITATPATPGSVRGVEMDDGVRVHRIDARLPAELPVNPAAPRLLRPLLHGLAPDVVHVQAGMVSQIAFDGAREADALRLPVLITWHCMLDGIRTGLRLAVAALGWDREPLALSAVSRVAAEQVAEVFGGYQPVGVVPNGIDPARWTPDEADRPAGPVHVVSTMRLAPRKRVLPLLRVLRETSEMLPPGVDVRATIVGDGPLLDRARRYLGRHRVPWVDLVGRVPHDELRNVYRSADIFVAPAELESFGIAALEARTAGLAIVARRGTGIADFVTDAVEGRLAGSDAEMAAVLADLICDEPERHRITEHNRTVAPPVSWPAVLRIVDEEYRRAIAIRAAV